MRRPLNEFLDSACPDHHVRGGPDHVRAQHTAMRLLARFPDPTPRNKEGMTAADRAEKLAMFEVAEMLRR